MAQKYFAGIVPIGKALGGDLNGITSRAALLAVGVVAAAVPAWRAGTTDPLATLREQ